MEPYKVCINHDRGMTLTFFYGKVNLRRQCIRMGKIGKCHLMAETLQGMSKWTEDFYENILGPGVCLPRGYIHVYDHSIQTSSCLKPIGQSKPNFMWKGTSRQRSGKGAIRKRFSLQKPRWEKTKLIIRYLYHENIS